MTSKLLALAPYLLPRRGCVVGRRLNEYERAFAAATGSSYAIGFWKGRVAFFAALKALGIREGDEVVMPAYTCMVIPAAVTFAGAKPVYVDIEPTYCTLDPDGLEAAITPRTRAVMIQHTYGWPAVGLDRIADITRKHGLPVIEDCCHALGTSVGRTHVGNFGVAGFFSTQWSKPFTTGLGGTLVCNDREFRDRVCRVRDELASSPSATTAAQLAWQMLVYRAVVFPSTMALARNAYRWLTSRAILTGSTAKKEYCGWQPDYLKRMCEVQAAAGLCELGQLRRTIEHRHDLARYYADGLREAGWSVPTWPSGADVTLLRFPVRVANKAEALQRADKQLVELGDWFVRPLHSHLAAQEEYGYATGMCPHADRAANEIVNLPMHGRIHERTARRVLAFLNATCRPAGRAGETT